MSSLLMFPVDLVRRRLQVQGFDHIHKGGVKVGPDNARSATRGGALAELRSILG